MLPLHQLVEYVSALQLTKTQKRELSPLLKRWRALVRRWGDPEHPGKFWVPAKDGKTFQDKYLPLYNALFAFCARNRLPLPTPSSRDSGEVSPVPKGGRVAADLETVHTLPELREWLKVRMRWLRDWHMARNNPKPIPPAFLDAIVSRYGESTYPPPNDPTKVHEWANEQIMRFSIHTVHEVHDWLETHDIFGGPDCPTLDPIGDERILRLTLEHLSRLLNFIGVRADRSPAPDVRLEGEQAEGEDRRQRKRRGRPADTDLQRDKRIYDAWQTRRYRKYAMLASELHMSERDVELAIDRERKRRKK